MNLSLAFTPKINLLTAVLHTTGITILVLGITFYMQQAHASRYYDVKDNYPTDGQCVPDNVYDDGSFIYICKTNGDLCPAYCIAETDDDGDYVYDYTVHFEVGEVITYDMSSALRCELDPNNGQMYQFIEEVTTEVVATSKISPSCEGGWSGTEWDLKYYLD